MENESKRTDVPELECDVEPQEEQVGERKAFMAPELKRSGSVAEVTGFTF